MPHRQTRSDADPSQEPRCEHNENDDRINSAHRVNDRKHQWQARNEFWKEKKEKEKKQHQQRTTPHTHQPVGISTVTARTELSSRQPDPARRKTGTAEKTPSQANNWDEKMPQHPNSKHEIAVAGAERSTELHKGCKCWVRQPRIRPA